MVSDLEWHVGALLAHLDPAPEREGLVETPRRVAAALCEMTAGAEQDAVAVLGAGFASPVDEMVVVQGLSFVSLCEHHLMTFHGTATVGYIPHGRILGLSKFARCLDVLSHRLQVQERLTVEFAEAVQEASDAQGVGVILRAHHSCMAFRGIRNGGETRTSALLGAMREDASARTEFLALA